MVPRREFFLPELGFCSTTSAYWQKIDRRVPLRHPRFLLISTDTAASTCPITDDQTPPRPGELARGSIQNSDSSPAEIGISPIKTVEFYFSNWSSDTKIVNRGICPGTPLVLSRPESGQPQPGRVGENRDQGARSEAGHHCFFFAGRYFFSIDATTT